MATYEQALCITYCQMPGSHIMHQILHHRVPIGEDGGAKVDQLARKIAGTAFIRTVVDLVGPCPFQQGYDGFGVRHTPSHGFQIIVYGASALRCFPSGAMN